MVLLALLFGLVGQYLLVDVAPGVSMLLFIASFYSLFLYSVQGRLGGFERWRGQLSSGWLLSVPIFLLALSYAIYANGLFRALNVPALFALIVAQTVLLTRSSELPWYRGAFYGDLLFLSLIRPLAYIATPFKIIYDRLADSRGGAGANGNRSTFVKISWGLLLAVPLLLVIISLLASADSIFSSWLNEIPNRLARLTNGEGVGRFIFGGMLGWYAFCYIWSLMFRKSSGRVKPAPGAPGGKTEAGEPGVGRGTEVFKLDGAGSKAEGARLNGAGSKAEGARLDGAGSKAEGARLNGAGSKAEGARLDAAWSKAVAMRLDGAGSMNEAMRLDGAADTDASLMELAEADKAELAPLKGAERGVGKLDEGEAKGDGSIGNEPTADELWKPYPSEPIRIDPVTASTLLVCINAVYVLFAFIQFSYLFGAADGLLPAGTAYAEYARRGFAELVLVALLNIGLLLAGLHLIRRSSEGVERLRKLLLTVLIGCTVVMLASAFSRLSLYEDAYGFTQTRLLVHGFMIYLGVLLIIAVYRIWRERFSLAKVYIAVSIAAYIVMNYANIDAIIADKNIARFEQSKRIDIDYLGQLSADAAPALSRLHERHPELAGLDEILQRMQLNAERENNWQSWNWSKSRVR
jgi:hypothetical protein